MTNSPKNFRLVEIASALSTTVEELARLLRNFNIKPDGNTLSPQGVAQLSKGLEAKSTQHRKYAQEGLERAVQQHLLILDTSAIMEPQFPTFVSNIRPLLQQEGKYLVVPSSVLAELKRQEVNVPEKRTLIQTGGKAVQALYQEDLLHIYGDERTTFGDNDLLSLAIRLRLQASPLFITQDKALTQDLLMSNNHRSVHANKVRVSKLTCHGFLSKRKLQEESHSLSVSKTHYSKATLPEATLVTACDDIVGTDRSAQTGDVVQGAHLLTLGAKLGSGGEGEIYDLGDGTVAKIFFPTKRTVGRKDKLTLMLQQSNPHPAICWPQELLCDQDGHFLGYRMTRAQGQAIQRCLYSRPLIESNFPHWDKTQMVELCVTILQAVTALHTKGILIGDINALNIMVVSSTQIYFVDTDSYQIGGYPCPVFTPRFHPPELQGKDPTTYLRTLGNESFALATLLFTLMLPGKSPYAQTGVENMEDAIAQMEFPYPCGEQGGKNPPMGDWRYIWSHLPRNLKNYFFGTFQRGEQYNAVEDRLTAQQWLSAFSRYHHLLESGQYQEHDPNSALIFPKELKKGHENNQVYLETRCSECDEPFQITEGERLYFEGKGLSLPTRCPKCRERRKLEALISQAS